MTTSAGSKRSRAPVMESVPESDNENELVIKKVKI